MAHRNNILNIPALFGSMKNASLYAISLFVIIALLSACKPEDSDIGADLIPGGDKLNLFTYETDLDAITVLEDSLPTFVKGTGLSAFQLGRYHDPVFGRNSAVFGAEFTPSVANFTYGAGGVVDSVILSLEYTNTSRFYGDISKLRGAQRFNVYRLTEDITSDTTTIYYSNHKLEYDISQLLGQKVLVPNVTDSVKWVKDSVTVREAPQLRIKLNNLAKAIFAPENQANFANATAFYNYFRGIYIQADNNDFQSPGDGAILRFNASTAGACRIRVFYHNDESTEENPFEFFDFVVNNTTRKVNVYQHNYKGTQLLQNLNQPNADRLFVQSMGGVKTKVILPNFDTVPGFGAGTYVVNKAELFIPVDPTAYSPTYPRPSTVVVLAPSSDTTYSNLINPPNANIRDLTDVSSVYYGGGFNNDSLGYEFGISLHLSDILNKQVKNKGLYIVNELAAVKADRLVLTNVPGRKIRLRIIYTKF